MVLLFIIGPPAVGKMAVGLEIEKKTGLKLLINHDTIEVILKFFEFGSPSFRRLDNEFRTRIFEEVAKSDLPGLIFTYVTALGDKHKVGEKKYIDNLSKIFQNENHPVFYVELEASLEERLRRNKCESRIKAKPSKRDTERSEVQLLTMEQDYIMNSSNENPFHYSENYQKLETTALSAEETAEMIINHFKLKKIKNLS